MLLRTVPSADQHEDHHRGLEHPRVHLRVVEGDRTSTALAGKATMPSARKASVNGKITTHRAASTTTTTKLSGSRRPPEREARSVGLRLGHGRSVGR